MSFTFWNMNPAKIGSSRYSSAYSLYNSYQPRLKIKDYATTDGLNICQNMPLNVEANVNSHV